MSVRRRELGQSLVEVILGMALFALLMLPLTLYTGRAIQDLFRAREVSERTDSYSRSAYLFTSGMAYAQMPLRQAYPDQLEYHVRLDDGDRYVMVWRDCRAGSGVVPGIYAAISSPRYNLVTNPSFETSWRETGYPDDADRESAPPGTVADGTVSANTGLGTDPVTRGQMRLGQATLGYNSTIDGTDYNQDYTIGAPQNWERHYRDDENRGDAVAPTEWPTAERVTLAQAQAGAAVAPTGSIRAGNRALRLTTWASLDARTRDASTDGDDTRYSATDPKYPNQLTNTTGADGRRLGHYFLFPQPQRATYTYLQSPVYSAAPGTRFLVGGYMADLTDAIGDTVDPNNRPRIEWYWVTSKNGKQVVIPERSGAVTMPDTDDDTPDGGLNAAPNDFSTYRYKITRPAPEGTVGIQLRLTPGLVTPGRVNPNNVAPIKNSDAALFDGIMLQPMSGPRIDTQRTNDYSADRSSRSPHTYFDGSVKVVGSDVWSDAYNPVIAAPAGRSWAPYWLGTPQLSASGLGSSSFANAYPPTAATDWTQPRIQNRAQLLFAFDGTSDPGCLGNLFTYYGATGAPLTTDSDRRTQTREVAVNLPVFRNPETADLIRFPVGSLLSPETPTATAPGLTP